MKNLIKAAGIAALALAIPLSTFAATVNSVQFSNGDTTISCTGGSTVQATFQITIPQNEVVENVRTTVGGQPFVDTSVGGTLGYQEGVQNIQASVKCPPNTGYYNLDIQTAGVYGGIRSVSGADGVNGSSSYGSSIRVVAGSDTSTAPSGIPADIWAKFLAYLAGNTPSTNAKCTTLSTKLVGAQMGVTNSQNGILQGYLIGEGYQIPLLQANQAPFGFWGVQTNAALTAYKTANSCN